MPLHISEIGVKLAVGGNESAPQKPAKQTKAPKGKPAALNPQQLDEIVEASVAKTLKNLREKEDR